MKSKSAANLRQRSIEMFSLLVPGGLISMHVQQRQSVGTPSEWPWASGRALIHTASIVGVVVLIALAVFFWRRNGIGSGRALGNRIAAHIGLPRSVFHSLLDNGAKGSSRDLLASLEKSKLGLDQASVELGPSLSRGIERLEARFGSQDMIDKAKPIVARLVAASEQKP